MKWHIFALIALVALTLGCVANQPQAPGPDIGSQAPPEPEVQEIQPTYCGLSVLLLSPSKNEQVSGGFRVEWNLVNGTGNFVNQAVNFTIYMRPASGGETTDLRRLSRYFGETYKEDVTFLSPVAKGNYVVGVRGIMEKGCTLYKGEADIVVN